MADTPEIVLKAGKRTREGWAGRARRGCANSRGWARPRARTGVFGARKAPVGAPSGPPLRQTTPHDSVSATGW